MTGKRKNYPLDKRLYGYFRSMATMLKNSTDRELKAALSPMSSGEVDFFEIIKQHGDIIQIASEANAEWAEELIHSRERNKKIVLTTYCYPVGVMYAFDCVPATAEVLTGHGCVQFRAGMSDFLDYSVEAGMTETSCSGQRASLGAYLSGFGHKPDFCIANTAGICDSNANAYHFYCSHEDIPMYMHDMPPTLTGKRATEYHRRDFRNMIAFLEKYSGKKTDWDKLREVAVEIKKQDELINEIQQLMTARPCPAPPLVQAFIYLIKFAMNGTRHGTRVLEEMLTVTRTNYEKGLAGTLSGKEKARCLSSYIDHYTYNMRFFALFNELEVSTLGSFLNYFFSEGSPYAVGREEQCYAMDLSSEEAVLDSLADQLARMPMLKQIRGPYDAPAMWLEDTLAACKIYQADCTLYMGTLGCRNTWGMVKPCMRDLEAAGYPSHAIFADSFDDRVKSWERFRKEMIEFFEVRKII